MNDRNRIRKKRMVWGGLFVFWLAVFETRAYAATGDETAAVLPVQQIFHTGETEEQPDGSFEYELTALEKENPLPESNTADGVYLFSMNGTESREIGPMVFTHGGIYHYQIRQKISEEKEHYTCDRTVYAIDIYVKNGRQGLTTEMIVRNTGGSKCEGIEFENTYTAPGVETTPGPAPTVSPGTVSTVKTGDENPVGVYVGIMILMPAVFAGAAVGGKKRCCRR